jgi:hypothetical protein
MTTSPSKNYTNITPKYDYCVNSLIKYYNENVGYSNAMDNIIKGKSNLPANVPKIPEGKSNPTINPYVTPKNHPKDIDKKQHYDFMNAVTTYMQDDAKTALDIANDDTYDLIIQQNTMYIFGSLACASLLIASIFIGKSNS